MPQYKVYIWSIETNAIVETKTLDWVEFGAFELWMRQQYTCRYTYEECAPHDGTMVTTGRMSF